MKKRVLSLMMALVLCLSMLPTEALAEGTAITTHISAESDAKQTGTNRDNAGNNSKAAAGTHMLLAANEADTVNVAQVTAGGTTTQYTDINEAFTAAQEADSATVTLLSNVTIAEAKKGICLEEGNITFDLNGHTLTSFSGSDFTADIVLWVSGARGDTPTYAALTLQDSSNGSGKIVQTNGIPAIKVGGYGELTVESGIIENSATENANILNDNRINCAILTSGKTTISGGTMSGINGVVVNGGTLTATDGTFTGTTGNALIVHDGTAQLSGGAYSNDTDKNEHSVWVMNDGKASSLLAEGYRYETTDGKASAYSENGNGVVGNTTVKERPAGEFSYIDAADKEAVQTGCKELTSEALYGDSDNMVGETMWYAASGDITLDKDLSVRGTLNLILCDGATVTAGYGTFLGYSEGAGVLNIYAQSAGTGRLTVTNDGQLQGRSAGIVSSHDGSSLNIYGGTVTATGAACVPSSVGEDDYSGAGIGTCANDQSGITLNVNIYGGTVIAKSGGKGGAAIGNGQAANGTVNVKIAEGMKCVQTDDLNTPVAYDNTDGTSVTITKCSDHQWEYTYDETNHTSICELCSTDGTTEAHTYENWKAAEDADTHTGMCVCGATKTESHNLAFAANADGLTHTSRCSTCGHEELKESHSFDSTTGKCACGVRLAAIYDGKSYATIQSAVDAAKGNNGTVTVQKSKQLLICENVTVDSGSVIIDLNGDNWCADDYYGGEVLRVNGGSVTLKNGTLSQGGAGTTGASAVSLESGSLTVEENVKIAGGYRGTSGTEYAIEVSGGELTLGEGVILGRGLGVPAGRKLADYLTAGTAFAGESGTIINGYTTGSTTEDLKVVEHRHTDFNQNAEDGGYYCKCGYPCPHSFDGDGKCTDCGAQAVAKIGEDGYLSVAAALDAVADGGTITLLADVSENVTVGAGRTVTFDVNSHSWNAWGTHTITVNGNVTVTGNGVMQNSGNLNDIFVGDGGQVHLTAGMTFSQVWAHNNASVTLDAGVIITNNIFGSGSDLFGFFAGKALQRYDLGNKEPVEGEYVPLNKDYGGLAGQTGCVIVIEHTQHIYSGTTGYCDVCGAACDHANMKLTDQSCPDCHAEYVASVVLTDVNGAAYPERFTVLQEALEYANSARIAGTDVKVKKAELTLLKNETVTLADGKGASDAVRVFDELTADMTVDINLNGKTLTCGNRFLNIYGGKVSIHDGSIHCTNAESVSAIRVEERNSHNPELTLTNVNITTTSDEFNETFSVCVYTGKLTIQGEGQYSVLEVYESDGVQLFGGSFEGIKMSVGGDFTSLLAKGYIYEDESGNFMSGDALAKQAEDTMNSKSGYRTDAVRVVKCENHSFEASRCTKCGFECLHKDGEESTLDEYGVCTVCDYACPHADVSETDGVTTCSDCKAQMVLKVTSGESDTYYARLFEKYGTYSMEATIKDVLNKAPDGSTVTLLADGLYASGYVIGGKTITLNMNGRTLIELQWGGICVGVDDETVENTLIVTGEGKSEKDSEATDNLCFAFRAREKGTLKMNSDTDGCSLHRICVHNGGTLIIDEGADITIDTLEIGGSPAKISIVKANFGEIIINPALSSLTVAAGSLLKENSGYAFRHIGEDGAFVPYDTVISTDSPLRDFRFDACRHDSLGEENTCEYCGTKYIAAIYYFFDTWYQNYVVGTYAADSFSTEAMQTYAGYAFDSHLNDYIVTLKLFVDVKLGDRVASGGGDTAIDLNGHKVTDSTLTLAKSSQGGAQS